MARNSASSISSVGCRLVRPAQLTRMSTFPREPITSAARDSSERLSVTSVRMRAVRRPRDSTSPATSSTCSRRRDVATTSAPASARPWTRARPIPDVPPVTTATLPSRSSGRYATFTSSPAVHRTVLLPVDGKVGPLVRELRGQRLVDVDSQPRPLAGVHITFGETVRVREHAIRVLAVAHVLLDAEVVHAEVEVKCGGHADGGEVGGAVAARADVVQLREL